MPYAIRKSDHGPFGRCSIALAHTPHRTIVPHILTINIFFLSFRPIRYPDTLLIIVNRNARAFASFRSVDRCNWITPNHCYTYLHQYYCKFIAYDSRACRAIERLKQRERLNRINIDFWCCVFVLGFSIYLYLFFCHGVTSTYLSCKVRVHYTCSSGHYNSRILLNRVRNM